MNPWEEYESVKKASGPWDEYSNNAPKKQFLSRVLDETINSAPVQLYKNIQGAVAEPILKLGTGLVAKPVSEVAGLAAMLRDLVTGNKDGNPVGFRDEVANKLTYEPRTSGGKSSFNPLNAIPEAIGSVISGASNLVADPIAGDSAADTARGATANAVREGIPQALGFLGVKKAPKAIQKLDDALAAREGRISQKGINSSVKDAAINEARANGFTLTPATADSSVIARSAEGVLGSPKLQHGAKIKNVENAKALVKKDLGIPDHTPLSRGAVEDIITKQGSVYEELKNIGKFSPDQEFSRNIKLLDSEAVARNRFNATANPEFSKIIDDLKSPGFDSADAVNLMKSLRAEASANLLAVERGNVSKPQQAALGKFQKRSANALEDLVARNLADAEKAFPGNGYGELSGRFKEARTTIAQSKNILKAMDEHGNIDAKKLGEIRSKGGYLTGETEKVAKFGAGFPELSSVPHGSMNVPITWTEGLIGGLGATLSPYALGYPLARGGGRAFLLSKAGQKTFGPPSYKAGALSDILRGAARTPETLQQSLAYALSQQRGERQE